MKKLLLSLCLSLAFAAQAFAIDLDTAKAQGLIGESNRGYLAYVVTPPSGDVVALVKSVNKKRRDKFTASARRNGITVEQVAHRFYERAVSATRSGNYYQTPAGVWVKK